MKRSERVDVLPLNHVYREGMFSSPSAVLALVRHAQTEVH
jgi:hypothetical protein